ncbi:polysaccharide biosynthesis/export family protein [Aurantiacibacter hainanensis]|uniref:polysaccharide biosynthesis/export family protein n=1 Tax=Aurantiacibacter hainanensis TaxID=3076114 RepID=UPI0030C77D43
MIQSALGKLVNPVLWLALAGPVLLGGCAGSRSDYVSYDRTGFGAPDAPSVSRVATDYRIAPLDKLTINVFQVEQLSGEYQVDLTGNIAMPLVGNVAAADMTTAELQRHLSSVLSEDYLRNPDVTVGILEATGSSITIEGSINNPGIYPTFGDVTLIQAVAMGGGLDDNANPRTVVVFRQIDGQRMAAGFDLTSIRRGEEPDPQIYRGDIIVVDGSRTRENWRTIIQSVPILSLFRPI